MIRDIAIKKLGYSAYLKNCVYFKKQLLVHISRYMCSEIRLFSLLKELCVFKRSILMMVLLFAFQSASFGGNTQWYTVTTLPDFYADKNKL